MDVFVEGASEIVGSVAKEVAPGVVNVLDIDSVVQEIDLQAALERVDLNVLLDGIDLDVLLARLDVQALIARLDVDEIIARLDVNALLEQVDVDALVERTEIGGLVARSGAGVAGKVLDVARSQGVGLDSFINRWMSRLLRRDLTEPPGGPTLLNEREGGHGMSAQLSQDVPERDLGLQGRYAGTVTRLAAFTIDAIAVLTLFTLAAQVGEYIVTALLGTHVQLSSVPIVAELLLAMWWVLYCAYPLAQSGRTLGMTMVGLRVVRSDGRDLGARRAVLRVLVFPLSFALFNLGFVLILLRRDRRALHDLISGSAVVYAWDARAARLRFLAKHGTE